MLEYYDIVLRKYNFDKPIRRFLNKASQFLL